MVAKAENTQKIMNEKPGKGKVDAAPKEKKSKAVKEKPVKKEKASKEPVIQKPFVEPFDVIKFVLMTEKSVRAVESQNKLVFIVKRNSRKPEIRNAVENAFESPVKNVTTVIDQAGRKKAFVKFVKEGAAGDIAIKLGII